MSTSVRVGCLLFFGIVFGIGVSAEAQETLTVGDSEVPVGGTGDAAVSWLDVDAEVQVVDMQLDLTGLPAEVSMQPIVVDFFSQTEEVCQVNPTTVAPNVIVSCNESSPGQWVMGLEQTQGLPFSGDVLEFVLLRFSADSSAAEGSLGFSISWISGTPAGVPVDTGSAEFQVSIMAVTAILDVSPVELDFDGVFTGSTSSSQEITISNQGSDGVSLQVTDILISEPFVLVGGGTCSLPQSLGDMESCTQRLVFSPLIDGPISETLTVESNAGEIINATVELSGEGVPPSAQLAFVQSPDYGVLSGPMYGGVVVHVLDTNGDLFTADSSTVVEMSLAIDPSGLAELSGTTQVTVSGGVAVFSDLSIDQVGNGFELRASDQAGELDSGDSDAFAVLPLELLQDRFENLD